MGWAGADTREGWVGWEKAAAREMGWVGGCYKKDDRWVGWAATRDGVGGAGEGSDTREGWVGWEKAAAREMGWVGGCYFLSLQVLEGLAKDSSSQTTPIKMMVKRFHPSTCKTPRKGRAYLLSYSSIVILQRLRKCHLSHGMAANGTPITCMSCV